MKSHHLFPPYLPLSIFIPSISPILVSALGLATLGRVVLTSWKKWLKDQRVKVASKS
jgi:hypothetical protein